MTTKYQIFGTAVARNKFMFPRLKRYIAAGDDIYRWCSNLKSNGASPLKEIRHSEQLMFAFNLDRSSLPNMAVVARLFTIWKFNKSFFITQPHKLCHNEFKLLPLAFVNLIVSGFNLGKCLPNAAKVDADRRLLLAPVSQRMETNVSCALWRMQVLRYTGLLLDPYGEEVSTSALSLCSTLLVSGS